MLAQTFQMVEVDIPQSIFEEQGRQLYGAKLLQIQVRTYKMPEMEGHNSKNVHY